MRTLDEAIDEINRELAVRRRLFPKWVLDGKISRTDALDRVERMETAIFHLEKLAAIREASLAMRPEVRPLSQAGQEHLPAGEDGVLGTASQT